MEGTITVNHSAIDNIVAGIERLSTEADKHATATEFASRSKGGVADELQLSNEYIAEYARTLAEVMRSAATKIREANSTMRETDEGLAGETDG